MGFSCKEEKVLLPFFCRWLYQWSLAIQVIKEKQMGSCTMHHSPWCHILTKKIRIVLVIWRSIQVRKIQFFSNKLKRVFCLYFFFHTTEFTKNCTFANGVKNKNIQGSMSEHVLSVELTYTNKVTVCFLYFERLEDKKLAAKAVHWNWGEFFLWRTILWYFRIRKIFSICCLSVICANVKDLSSTKATFIWSTWENLQLVIFQYYFARFKVTAMQLLV